MQFHCAVICQGHKFFRVHGHCPRPTLEAALQINQLGKSWFLFGSLNFEWRAIPEPAGCRGIGSSNSRFQPRSTIGPLATILDRLPQPLHSELDILRLQLAPAFDLSPIARLGEALEIFLGMFPGGRALAGEFFTNERVSGHCAHQTAVGDSEQ